MGKSFLFTGEETYLLHQELSTWKKAFIEKYGEQGFFAFASHELDIATIKNTLMGGGMFSTKKLIYIYGVPKDSNTANKAPAANIKAVEEYLLEHIEHLSDDIVLAIISYKPDKRTSGYKKLSKICDIKTFAPLKDKQVIGFIEHQLGSLVTTSTAAHIGALVGTNLYHVSSECEKLKLYAGYHAIEQLTQEHINQVVYAQHDANSFAILDNLFSNKDKTLSLIKDCQEQQQDMFQFLGMLYRGLKMVIQMIDLHEKGVGSSKEMASKLKLHPFAVAKQHKHIPKLSNEKYKIHNFYQQLLTLDHGIKTGQYPSQGFWLRIKSLVYEL